MTKIEQLERDVERLDPGELATFRKWFEAFDAAVWDRQLETDVSAGKLDALADAAIRDHKAGRSRKL